MGCPRAYRLQSIEVLVVGVAPIGQAGADLVQWIGCAVGVAPLAKCVVGIALKHHGGLIADGHHAALVVAVHVARLAHRGRGHRVFQPSSTATTPG